MHASIPTTYVSLIFCIFFSFLSFLSFSTYLPSISCSSPFIVHNYHFLYYLPRWDLPFLLLNCFWLIMGFLPRLPISLQATQPLPLLWMCWLQHSSFPNKIACLISYLSLFFTSFIWIRIKSLHYLSLWHASSGSSPCLPLLGEMSPQRSLSENPKIDPLFLPTTKPHLLNTLTCGLWPAYHVLARYK